MNDSHPVAVTLPTYNQRPDVLKAAVDSCLAAGAALVSGAQDGQEFRLAWGERRMRLAIVARGDRLHVAMTDAEPGWVDGTSGRRYAQCGARYTSVSSLDPRWSWNRKRITCAECREYQP